MEELTIKFKTTSAAFDDGMKNAEIALTLRRLADSFEGGFIPKGIFDTNGNRIGDVRTKGKVAK